jgi:hypothetical protein
MSDDQLSRRTPPREAPPFASDPRDEYVHRVVGWVLRMAAAIFVLGGIGVVLAAVIAVGDHGSPPFLLKVAYLLGGLSAVLGIGFAIASGTVPPPNRTYRSSR